MAHSKKIFMTILIIIAVIGILPIAGLIYPRCIKIMTIRISIKNKLPPFYIVITRHQNIIEPVAVLEYSNEIKEEYNYGKYNNIDQFRKYYYGKWPDFTFLSLSEIENNKLLFVTPGVKSVNVSNHWSAGIAKITTVGNVVTIDGNFPSSTSLDYKVIDGLMLEPGYCHFSTGLRLKAFVISLIMALMIMLIPIFTMVIWRKWHQKA